MPTLRLPSNGDVYSDTLGNSVSQRVPKGHMASLPCYETNTSAF